MSGAAHMSAVSALRGGAGLVSVATRLAHAAVLNLAQPEFMSYPVQSGAELKPLLNKVTVAAVGPGLGRVAWGQRLYKLAVATDLPLVMDADALYWLAKQPAARGHWILTPHPGEAARLLNASIEEVQADRYAAVRELADRYAAVAVLKGAGSLITGPLAGKVWVCDRGHPGMASGGMGDVLTGLMAALVAQGLELLEAAKAAVWVHGRAAELAAEQDGERGLLATDLLPFIRRLLNAPANN
jgi:hydroxyethylthiazole kinase-like uncharacterized protein yjeF